MSTEVIHTAECGGKTIVAVSWPKRDQRLIPGCGCCVFSASPACMVETCGRSRASPLTGVGVNKDSLIWLTQENYALYRLGEAVPYE